MLHNLPIIGYQITQSIIKNAIMMNRVPNQYLKHKEIGQKTYVVLSQSLVTDRECACACISFSF